MRLYLSVISIVNVYETFLLNSCQQYCSVEYILSANTQQSHIAVSIDKNINMVEVFRVDLKLHMHVAGVHGKTFIALI